MAEQSDARCIHCDRSSHEVPLVELRVGDEQRWICPQHLPILIHRPHELVGKLAGVENLDEKTGH
jgi:hypothetical protein